MVGLVRMVEGVITGKQARPTDGRAEESSAERLSIILGPRRLFARAPV